MELKNVIIGNNISLRSAYPEDAEFILSLRLNPQLNAYLKRTDPSVEKQREWIQGKLNQTGDYHMIIESSKGEKLGVIALYSIDSGKFDWGRWLIKPDADKRTALESVILLYKLAFETLKLEKTLFEVRKQNKKVIKFHKSYGARKIKEDEKYNYYEFNVNDYEKSIIKKLR